MHWKHDCVGYDDEIGLQRRFCVSVDARKEEGEDDDEKREETNRMQHSSILVVFSLI